MRFIILLLVVALSACSSLPEKGNKALVEDYYKAYNQKDYARLNELITDSITISEAGYEVLNTKAAFIDLVEWGEVFEATNEVVSMEEFGENVLVKELQSSSRILFFYGEPLEAETTFYFEDGKISKFNSLLNFKNMSEAGKKLKDFGVWVDLNHNDKLPVLSQLNKEGAQAYVELLEAYQEAKGL